MAFGDLARQDDYAIDPLTGVPLAPSSQAQGKFGRIADAIVGGLRNWIETPGRALRGETTPEEAYQWGPATAFGMIAGSKLPGGAAGSGMTKLPGIKAYHGSPHDFDKFDLSKIGTGEGAQAYGHGLYFAENEGVARNYRDNLAQAGSYLKNHGSKEAAITHLQGQLKSLSEGGARPEMLEQVRGLIRDLETGKHGRMYEVNLNADPKQFLDWDRPLSQQPNVVQDLARNADLSHLTEGNRTRVMLEKFKAGKEQSDYPATGHTLHNALEDYGMKPRPELSAYFKERGIPGVRYLDQGSRPPPQYMLDRARQTLAGAEAHGDPAWIAKNKAEVARLEELMTKPGTSNYVVFDPGIIDILRKYGLAGAGATGFGTLAAQDNHRQ